MNVGIVGLGNVGMGTIAVLTENAKQIKEKLGFDLKIKSVCSRVGNDKELPDGLKGVHKTTDWREVVTNPDVDIVAELVGGTGVAKDIIEAAVKQRKSIVTANKELMALSRARNSGTPRSRRESILRWKQASRAAFRFMPCCAKASPVTGLRHCSGF